MNSKKQARTFSLWSVISWSLIIIGGLSLAAAYLLFGLRCAESGFLSGRLWPALPGPVELALLLSPFLGLVYFQIYAGRTLGGRLALCLAAVLMFSAGFFMAWPSLNEAERGFSDFLVGWGANMALMMTTLLPATIYELIRNCEDSARKSPKLRPLGVLPVMALLSLTLGSSLFRYELGMCLGAASVYAHLGWLGLRRLIRSADWSWKLSSNSSFRLSSSNDSRALKILV